MRGSRAVTLDTDDHGRDGKSIAIRSSFLVSAVSHTLLGFYAISLPFTLQGSGGSGSEDAAATILRRPFGRYLLAAVDLAILGAGVPHTLKGLSGRFKKHPVMCDRLMAVPAPFCAFGLAARGVKLLIVGSFFVYAACTFEAHQDGGAAAARHRPRTQNYGAVLLLVIAAPSLCVWLLQRDRSHLAPHRDGRCRAPSRAGQPR